MNDRRSYNPPVNRLLCLLNIDLCKTPDYALTNPPDSLSYLSCMRDTTAETAVVRLCVQIIGPISHVGYSSETES